MRETENFIFVKSIGHDLFRIKFRMLDDPLIEKVRITTSISKKPIELDFEDTFFKDHSIFEVKVSESDKIYKCSFYYRNSCSSSKTVRIEIVTKHGVQLYNLKATSKQFGERHFYRSNLSENIVVLDAIQAKTSKQYYKKDFVIREVN